MTRFFFDCIAQDRSLHDYQGTEFGNPEGAIEFAEAMAGVMRDSLVGEWRSWTIEVRTAEGKKLAALAVGAASPIAA
jgi:hypothetical protein